MPVTGATTRNDYSSGNNQTVFVYTFQILLATDIKVLKNGSVLTFNDDYAVSNVGVAGGGNVTLTSGASAGDEISIFLAMPIDRTTQYQNAGDFLASDVNGDMDKGYVAMNQLQTDIRRVMGLQDRDPSSNMELPLSTARANRYLKFNHSGEPTAVSGELYSSADLVSIKFFGAVGDGATDDSVAITAALNSGDNLFVPEGTYYIPNWTTVARSTPLKMWGTGTFKGLNKVDTFVRCLSDVSVTGVGFEQFAFVFENERTDPVIVDRFHLNNVTVKNCGGGITLETAVNTFTVSDCYFDTLVSDKPIRVGYNTYAYQDNWKNFTITGNTFRNISTVSGTDCNVLLIYGKQVAIAGNTFDTIGAAGTFETFSGDGSNKTFIVAEPKLNEGQCTLYLVIGGKDVEQVNTDDATLWTLNGTTKQLTFTTAPAVGTNNIKFYYAGESAAVYTKARFSTITGNSISGMGKLSDGTTTLNVNQIYGINVKGRGRGDTERNNGYNVTVTGNTLEGVNGFGSGIRIQNDCVNVTGNNIEKFRWGVNGNTAVHDDSNISNNNIYHCSQYGINVIQSGTNCIVQGNNITGLESPTPWLAGELVILGNKRSNGGNVYKCSQAGRADTSGTGPSGTGTDIVDGSAKWDYVSAFTAGVYEPLAAIHVKGHSDTENYNISNNSISGCKKGIKISSIAEAKTDWTASTAFALGDKVVNNSINYKCTTAGTSASSGGGPTGTGSAIADGSVVWQYVTAGAEISNVLITNNTLSNVTGNGVEFADCNTITVENNQYKGEVTSQFIRPVSPNQNVTVRDSRTKTLNTNAVTTLQTFNTSVVDQAVRVTASVTAKQGDAEFAAYKITGLFKVSRETVIVEGEPVVVVTLAQVGSTATEYAITSSGAASWGGASFIAYEGDLLLRVHGTAATPATVWSAKTEYVSTTDALL